MTDLFFLIFVKIPCGIGIILFLVRLCFGNEGNMEQLEASLPGFTFRQGGRKPPKFLEQLVLLSMVYFLLLALAVSGLLVASLLIGYRDVIDNATRNPLIMPIAFLVATLMYLLKRANSVVYGGVELLVAAVALSYATQADALLPRLLALASGIYIVVRGLDNMDKGVSSELHKTLRWLFRKAAQ